MRGIFIFAATVCCLLATSAKAQTAPASQPSARQLYLASQVISANGLRANYGSTLHGMMSQISASMMANSGKQSPKVAAAMKSALDDEFDQMIPKMLDVVVQTYARDFTEQELSDLLAFYQSPSGRSMIAKTPQVAHDVMASTTPLVPSMQRDLIEDFCVRMDCTPEMKKSILDRLPGSAPKT